MPNLVLTRRRALASAAALAALAVSGRANAARPYSQLQELLDAWVAERRVAGAVAAVKTSEAATLYLSAGNVALGALARVDETTIWRIYSMTKPITGLAALMLVEEGKLGLDQPISAHLPEFRDMRVMQNGATSETRPARSPITVRHLLTHTAGLSYTIHEGALERLYRRDGLFAAGRAITLRDGDGRPPPTLDEFGARLARLPLIADPGARWRYSLSLDLLGLVIQRASGQPFDQFLHRRIFAPLRMLDTAFYVPPEKLERFTTNYARAESGLRVADERGTSAYAQQTGVPYGGAGLVSTARDYARFCEMLLNEGALDGVRIARRETVRLAHSDLLPDGVDMRDTVLRGSRFGAGVSITSEASALPGETPVGAYGWGGAASTLFWIDPANQAAFVLMTQVFSGGSNPFTSPFRQTAYRDLAALPRPRREPVDITARPRRNF
jgi:CubicO group peptidase (beta-lactamase class C family)